MLVSRMQFATALHSCCLVVSSCRTQGACFYTTVQICFLLGIDGLAGLPSQNQSGSFQESKKVSKRESHVCSPRTSMHLKDFPLIGTEIEICSVHRCIGTVFFTAASAGFIWDCLGTAGEDQPGWRYSADLAATTPGCIWLSWTKFLVLLFFLGNLFSLEERG